MRRLLLWLCVLYLGGGGLALPQEATNIVSRPPWRVVAGPMGAEAIEYEGTVLARHLRLGGYAPEWKGGRFDMSGAAISKQEALVAWKKAAPGNQEATIEVELQANKCVISCETTVTQAGPSELSLELEPEALACAKDYMHVIVDGKRQGLELAGPFSTLNLVKEIRFELIERTILIHCEGFAIQDRRARGQGLFLVAVLPSSGKEPVTHRKTIEIIVEPAAPETIPARRAYLSQREYTRRELPLKNGDFEAGLENWSSNPRAAIETQIKHSGAQSARITIPETQEDATGIYLVQNVPAQEGKLYQVTAYVRADNVKAKTLGDRPPAGVTVIVEFADKQGHWLAPGSYAEAVYGTQDWKQISTEAVRAPVGTGFAIIFLAVRATGTGYFDDVKIYEITQHVVLESPGNQTTFADNTPRFVWSIKAPGPRILELAPSADFPAAKTLRFAAIQENTFTLEKPLPPGRWFWRLTVPQAAAVSAVWQFQQTAPETADCTEPVIAPDHAFVSQPNQRVTIGVSDNVGVTKFALTLDGKDVTKQGRLTRHQIIFEPAQPWARGLHRLRVEAWDAAGNRAERVIYLTHATGLVEKKWLPQGGIAFNGRPRFLLGMYGVRIEDMEEIARGGFDFVHNYTWDGPGTNETALEYLDACQKQGLQAFIGFYRAALQANDLDFVAERIGALIHHPALLAWYLFDEPDLPHQFVPPSQLRNLYQFIKKLDPTRPVIVTVAQHNMMPEYHDSYDVYWSMDYSTPASNVKNFEYHRSQLKPGVPLMSILHCFDGKQRGQDADPNKFWPDAATMHAAAFMAIAHNSSGLCWWWWGQGSNIYLTVAHVPWAWEALKKTVAQIRALRPVLESQAPSRMWIEIPAEGQEVHCWEKKLPDRAVIIAVNRDPQPCRATIKSPLLKAGPVHVLFESRTITAQAGSLSDDFASLGVHVYEIR